ncbi:effector-associated constant component EACC1 [Streptomyces sp. NPDC054757]
MDLRVTADGEGRGDLRAILEWLLGVDELRGRVTPQERPPVPGTLGPVLDALAVALGQGGAATGVVTALVSWLRGHRSDVTVKVTRPDGASVELSAQRVRLLGDQELRSLVQDAARALDAPPAPPGDTPEDPDGAGVRP